MIDSDRRKRFLQDPAPVRLGNLASNLSRIASCIQRPAQAATALAVLDESKHFIEWMGPEAAPEIQPDLVGMQVELARWQLRWSRILLDASAKDEVARRARQQAEQVLQWSGLLNSTD